MTGPGVAPGWSALYSSASLDWLPRQEELCLNLTLKATYVSVGSMPTGSLTLRRTPKGHTSVTGANAFSGEKQAISIETP